MRQTTSINHGWRFHRGDPPRWSATQGYGKALNSELMKAGSQGLSTRGFDDCHWRQVDLPHDFVIEGRFDPGESSDRGSLATGSGWYRRRFQVADREPGERVALVFDGVYRDAQVWVDGWLAGRHGSGYLGFRLDITDLLEEGDDEHVVVVRCDASGMEGWWYDGGGIYRHVWLERHADLAVAPDGVYARCDGEMRHGMAQAGLLIDTELASHRSGPAGVRLRTSVCDDGGRIVAQVEGDTPVPAGGTVTVAQRLTLAAPRLWHPEHPDLYTIISEVLEDGAVLDRVETRTGVRSFAEDPTRGFLINGEAVKLKGFCCHQDLGGVGVALTDSLHAYKLERLHELGANAYRSAHHPPAPALLDAADRLGIVVMCEHRLPGFDAENLDLLRALVRRDRSRACVGIWSLFNEEVCIQGRDSGGRLVGRMAAEVLALDRTRPITAAVNACLDGPVAAAVPVVGINYQHTAYDLWRAANPTRPALASETASSLATRGVHHPDDSHSKGAIPSWSARPVLQPGQEIYARVSADGATAPVVCATPWEAWKPVAEREWLGGAFVWTGFDYYGEPVPHPVWPAVSSNFGALDLGGLPKDSAFAYRAMWRREASVHLGGHWSWPGSEGQPVPVRIFGNADEVELVVNGRLIERIALPLFAPPLREIPYEPGWIEARAYRAGGLVAVHRLTTVGEAHHLRLVGGRTRLTADGQDSLVLHVAVEDAAGQVVPTAHPRIRIEVQGAVRYLGGANGDPCDRDAPTDSERNAWAGWLSFVVRAGHRPGVARIVAQADHLGMATLELVVA